ncbi:MarR family transcriptional regulator [Pseudosulfitobacter sp. DSM 107133]|jgi:DNA-binding MarR family transcriptional regulator|uniref:MarR family winged helix-turn-helix transcriptional regulator n=1 Tax=Pseudosulfitobacter sp. DSM 107133 TaxID=2883100 RepID=UPI000DF2D63D|nr:MarR family transcriptional regulator [Pseudosulfitobacter sp. DSM 107133]UOA26599.1 Transcriptional regulator SlyA [Pseudosulfitobacter sp. DSM 107133]
MKDDEKILSQFDLRQFLTYRLSKLQNALNAQAGHVLASHGDITLTEWRILYILRSMSTATMSQIVKESRLDKAQISRAIKGLVDKGLIASVQDERDQRRQLLSATAEGRALKEKILPIMMRRQEAMTEGLTQAEIDTFIKVLDQLDETALRREF